jgi:putative molybdopterin biosynthesis protein
VAGRNTVLSAISPAEAVARAMAALDRDALMRVESVPTEDCLGRVTAGPVHAQCSSPTFHSAAMDGIAVHARATLGATEDTPLLLKRGADWHMVNTGNLMPAGMDAVIKTERLSWKDEDTIAVTTPAFPWQHVRRLGEDIVATELLQNHRLTPYDVGALLTGGVWEVPIFEKVRLLFIPTGDEVLPFQTRPMPLPGQVIESNSQVFCAMARTWGALARSIAPVKDRPELLRRAVEEALNSDAHIVVVGAGSSAGTRDYARQIFESVGEILVPGLTIMPGKPSLVGVARGKLLVGAPGYPRSSVACSEHIIAPMVSWLGRTPAPGHQRVSARVAQQSPSRRGVEESVHVALGRVGGDVVAVPLKRGAGMISTLTKARGLLRIAPASEGVEQGEMAEVELFVPLSELDATLIHMGSHDNIMDLLTNELMGLTPQLHLVSRHVGSMGGLKALRDDTALFAGCHLFDPHTRDFNFPFIVKHLPGVPVSVVNLAIRQQGLIVAAGNPKGIRGVQDLTREDVIFVNRQPGAGTRILLDHHLKEAGIGPDEVCGYDHEEHTHMAVAANMLTGTADCGLGIFAAAKALELDFVPLARERYDLVIPRRHMDDNRVQALLRLVRSRGFQSKVASLGGYEVDLAGREMRPGRGLGT